MDWEVAGAEISREDGASIALQIPTELAPVTVSVTIKDDSGPIAFGTRTFLPLTREESLRLEIVTLIREIATRGADPSATMTVSTLDPMLISRSLGTVNLTWIRDNAARRIEATTELIDIWRKTGTRSPIIPDPRK